MEIDNPENVEVERRNEFLMALVKRAQTEHGLSHNDYARYRQYCSARVHKLRKKLKLTHGKHKFQKKVITPELVRDVRALHIPLVSAERSWAMAQEIKNEIEANAGNAGSVKRSHMISRLRKASRFARDLARLSSVCCDTRTHIEAEGYYSWMEGSYRLDGKQDYQAALGHLHRARVIFSKLSSIGPSSQQRACRQLLQDIDSLLRACKYHLERQPSSAGAASEDDLLQQASTDALPASHLAEKLDALQPDSVSAARTEDSSKHYWRGQLLEVQTSAISAHLQATTEWYNKLHFFQSAAPYDEDTDALDADVAALDKIAASLAAAQAATAAAAAAAVGSGGGAADSAAALKSAIDGSVLEASMLRGMVAAVALEKKLEQHGSKAARSSKATKGKTKGSRPEDMVRAYEMLVRCAQELMAAAEQLRGVFAEELLAEAEFQVSLFAGARACFVGHAVLSASQPHEAHAVFSVAAQRLADAREKLGDAQQLLARLRVADVTNEAGAFQQAMQQRAQHVLQWQSARLDALQMHADAFAAVARIEIAAAAARETKSVTDRVQGLSLAGSKSSAAHATQTYLTDDPSQWVAHVGTNGRNVRIARTHAALHPIACRPITLDAAAKYIDAHRPDLSAYLPAKPKAGFLGSFFSWSKR